MNFKILARNYNFSSSGKIFRILSLSNNNPSVEKFYFCQWKCCRILFPDTSPYNQYITEKMKKSNSIFPEGWSRRITLVVIIVVFQLFGLSIQAQQTTEYTLAQVIRLAQDQSPDAQIARHKFKISYWSYRNYKAAYLPQLSLNGEIPNINRSIEALSFNDGTSQYVERSYTKYMASLSLEQQVGFTGGSVFLNTGLQQTTNFFPDSDSTSSGFLANIINFGISQPIFKYNAYKWDKQIQPLEYEEAKRALVEANESVASEAVDRFFSLLIAQIQKDIALKNRSNYDTLYRIAKGRYQLGKIAENELLQLELNLLQADASVEDADLNYQISIANFRSYLRIKDEEDIKLIPPDETTHFEVPADRAIDEAQNNSSEGIAFRRRLIVADSKVNEAKMDGRFDADLYAVVGLTQSGGKLTDAYSNPLDEERVTLGIQIPLMDWGLARGKIKLAESAQELEMASVDQERIDYVQNIFVNVMRFNQQKNQLRIAAKSDTVAQKRYDVTQKRYMIGKVNDVLELNMAQIDNDNAKIGYYRALMTYWKSYYQIRKITLFDFEKDMPILVPFEDLLK